MVKHWRCPYAVPTRFDVLMCSLLVDPNEIYDTKQKVVQAFCAHQKQCNCTHRVENSEGAQECYSYRAAQAVKISEERQENNNEPNFTERK